MSGIIESQGNSSINRNSYEIQKLQIWMADSNSSTSGNMTESKDSPPKILPKPSPQEPSPTKPRSPRSDCLRNLRGELSVAPRRLMALHPLHLPFRLPPRVPWQPREIATWVPEARVLEPGSNPGQRMLSPERLALPDYEYLGRSFLQLRGRKVKTN